MSGGPPDTTPAPSADTSSVAVRVNLAWRELRRGAAMGVLRDHWCGTGDDALEPGQIDTLEVLVQFDSWRMSDLADALRVDPSTATRAVDRLVRIGLAERTHCSDDKRVVRVSATDSGRRRASALDDLRRRTMDRILAHYEADERLVLAEYLERFVRALDEVSADLGRPVQP